MSTAALTTPQTAPSPSGPASPARARDAFVVRPFDGPLGAEVLGLDLAEPLSDDDFARLHRAHLEHHVLVFRDQHITPTQHVAFTRRWGELQRHVLHQFALQGHPAVLVVSNIVEGGRPIGLGDAGVFRHSDLSYKERRSPWRPELFAHATQSKFVYRHRWQPHDLVFWDNRSVQHLAAGCAPEQRRRLYRTTIEGDIPA